METHHTQYLMVGYIRSITVKVEPLYMIHLKTLCDRTQPPIGFCHSYSSTSQPMSSFGTGTYVFHFEESVQCLSVVS